MNECYEGKNQTWDAFVILCETNNTMNVLNNENSEMNTNLNKQTLYHFTSISELEIFQTSL